MKTVYSVYVSMRPVQNVMAESVADAIRKVKKSLGPVRILNIRVN